MSSNRSLATDDDELSPEEFREVQADIRAMKKRIAEKEQKNLMKAIRTFLDDDGLVLPSDAFVYKDEDGDIFYREDPDDDEDTEIGFDEFLELLLEEFE